MSSSELRTRRRRIKVLAAEIEAFPTSRLIDRICNEANAGIDCDGSCASAFASVREVALRLMVEGVAGTTTAQLAAEVASLDTVVAVRLMQDCNHEAEASA